MFVFQRYT